jgi:hypothetical protein
MLVFITLIPITRNDGTPVPEAEQEEILESLVEKFGSLTIEGTIRGIWQDPETGNVHREKSLKVKIGCDLKKAAIVPEVIREIGIRLGQKEMYLEMSGGAGLESVRCR